MKVKDLQESRTKLYGSLSRDIADFEKNFLLISSGLLAFSITFIKDIIKPDVSKFILILYSSWLAIIIAISLILYAFYYSYSASNNIMRTIIDFQKNNNLYNPDADIPQNLETIIRDTVNTLNKGAVDTLKKMRASAMIALVLGLLLLGTYTALNITINDKNDKSDKTNIELSFSSDNIEISIIDTTNVNILITKKPHEKNLPAKSCTAERSSCK